MRRKRNIERTVPHFIYACVRVRFDHELSFRSEQMRAHHPTVSRFATVKLHDAVSASRATDMHEYCIASDDTVVAPVSFAQFTAMHNIRFCYIVSLIRNMRLNPRDAIQEEVHFVEIVHPHLHQLETGFSSFADLAHRAKFADFASINQGFRVPKERRESELMTDC